MRITAQAKTETRDRILTEAARLFHDRGWENATTRDIAAAAGIANGTLFNYFPSKEAIAAALIEDATAAAFDNFQKRRTGAESLAEDLFSFVWGGLKSLRKFRKFLAPALDIVFSPLAQPTRIDAGAALRARHLESVSRILQDHGVQLPLSAVIQQLYWTLYLGVLAFWAADNSPHQEDSLALLDRSLRLFAGSFLNHPAADLAAEGVTHHGRKTK